MKQAERILDEIPLLRTYLRTHYRIAALDAIRATQIDAIDSLVEKIMEESKYPSAAFKREITQLAKQLKKEIK